MADAVDTMLLVSYYFSQRVVNRTSVKDEVYSMPLENVQYFFSSRLFWKAMMQYEACYTSPFMSMPFGCFGIQR